MRLYCSQTGIEWGGYGVRKRAVSVFLGSIRAMKQALMRAAWRLRMWYGREEVWTVGANFVRGAWAFPSLLFGSRPLPSETCVSLSPTVLKELDWSREAFPPSESWHFLNTQTWESWINNPFCLLIFPGSWEKANLMHAFQVPYP